MHQHDVYDTSGDVFKTYSQVFNLRKFKADQRLLGIEIDEESLDGTVDNTVENSIEDTNDGVEE